MAPTIAEKLRAELADSEQRRKRLRKNNQILKRKLARANRELAALVDQPAHENDSELGYVFIVTYGRSGSTLLQGILSSNPGWLIRGENGDAMRPLYEFQRNAEQGRDKRLTTAERSVTDAWFGMDDFPTTMSIRAIRRLAIDTILRPESDTRVAGFKEIRWWHHDDLPEYADFLQRVFPGARFVINTRNLEDVAQSKWWAKLEDPVAELTRHEKRILGLKDHLGDAAYHIHYDDYIADQGVLAPLFEWLGEDYDEQRIADVLATPHSY